MHRDYANDVIRELRNQQVRYAPREKKIEQAARAEEFLYEIDPRASYPYKDVCFRVTDYKPEFHANDPLGGASLKGDLLRFIEDLYGSAAVDVAQVGERVWTIEELCLRFSVTAKTISRWRKTSLVGRRFTIDGKNRIGFLDSSLTRFLETHQRTVERGGQFSQLSDKEKTTILRLARRLAKAGGTPTEIARRLAEKTGRSIETIRYTLKNFDEQNPDIALFPNRKTPMNDDLRRLIFHRYRLGESVEHLADVFQRTVGSVYRVVGQMRAARIRELPLDYVAAPEFKSLSPEQVARYCRAVPQEVETNPAPKYPRRMEGGLTELPDFVEIDAIDEPDRKTERRAAGGFKVRPDSGLPPYLEGLYLNPLLTRTQETHLFRKMNLLKYEAAALRESLDPEHPKSHIMSKIERLYDDAIATKNRIVTANLRLVVSIAKRHIGTGINFFDLISDGNIALIRAVEKFDYTRGNKFSTYATWAVIRCFARAIPDEKKHRLRYRLVEDELFDMQEDSRTDFHIEEKEQTEREVQIDRLLGELDEREQQIITRRYGLGDSKASQTLREVGSEMGVTKERVRQIEARALQKLRKVVEEENLEIPGL